MTAAIFVPLDSPAYHSWVAQARALGPYRVSDDLCFGPPDPATGRRCLGLWRPTLFPPNARHGRAPVAPDDPGVASCLDPRDALAVLDGSAFGTLDALRRSERAAGRFEGFSFCGLLMLSAALGLLLVGALP